MLWQNYRDIGGTKMKDVTFGVKVPEDLRDEINEMMKDSGLVGREFMQQLIDSYMLDKTKQEIPEMAEEIKELELLTHRINEMYLYLGTRFQNIIATRQKEKEQIGKNAEEEKKSYEESLEEYKSKANSIKEEILKIQEELKSSQKTNQELSKKIEDIKGYNENYKELNAQYKNNIEKLTKEIEDLMHFKTENDTLVLENSKLKENNDRLASELWFSKREIEKLEERLSKDKEEYNNHISRLKEQHHLERQTALLESQLEHQKTIETLNAKTANIQKEYNDKLKELLFNTNNKQVEAKNNEGRNNKSN